MLNQILAITIKDLKVLVRDRGGMVALFLMPVMFILVMSAAQQNMYDIGGQDNPVELIVVNNDHGDLADDVINALQAVDGIEIVTKVDGQILTQAAVEDMIVEGTANVAVVIPENFTDSVMEAATSNDVEAAVITFIADPTTSTQFLAPIRGSIEGFIQEQAAYAQMPLRIGAGFDQIAGFGVFVHRRQYRGGTIGCGNAGGNALLGLDGNGKAGLKRRCVVLDH